MDDDDSYRGELLYLAVRLATLATWADDALAGGSPPKWVALQLIEAIRYIRTVAIQARHQ